MTEYVDIALNDRVHFNTAVGQHNPDKKYIVILIEFIKKRMNVKMP